MASEDCVGNFTGDADGLEENSAAVESCNESPNSLTEQEKAETLQVGMESLLSKQQPDADHKSGPETDRPTNTDKEKKNNAEETVECSEDFVIGRVEDFTNETAVDEDGDGRMEVDGPEHSGNENLKSEKLTQTQPQVAQPVKVKDEPLDEEYEEVSTLMRPVGNIKDEPETECNPEADSIKISAVFSVGGNPASIGAPAGIAAKVQSVPAAAFRPLAPANPIGVACTGCNKVLLKGQTAFQRKGCPKLFCSPQCLCSTSMLKTAPKKHCHHCLKEILDLKDVISAPADVSGTVKEFCSQACFNTATLKCSVCQKAGVMANCTCEEPVEMVLDSDEEYIFSSEEDYESEEEHESEDEWLHFGQRFDPAKDIQCDKSEDENGQTPAAKKPRTKRQSTQTWQTEADIDIDMVTQTLKFLPARQPGPQLWSTDSYSPITLFKLFFNESAVTTLCQNTNIQAAKSIAKGRKYKWTDVSVTEMYRYFGLIFYMSIVKLTSITDYWRQGSLFSVCFPAMIMARERYRTISWNMHMSHTDKKNDRIKGTDKHDPLFRVRPLMDTIRMACRTIYHPRRSIAVDERTVAFRSTMEIGQYKKAKPTKPGFKLFALTDSSNGYTVDFSVYTGKNYIASEHGLPYDIVMSLVDKKFLGSGYHMYMDSFFTSPKLLIDLLDMKYGACGTYKSQWKNVPQNSANALTRKSTRGSIRWFRDGPILFVKWMDKEEVSVCSTIHPAYTGNSVQRRVKTHDTWSIKTFRCPAPVTAYNQYMGGIDRPNQLLQYYTTQHQAMKWYRKIILHFLDMAATNSFIMHKELYGNLTHKEFMEQLIAELCGMSVKIPPKKASSDHVPVPGAPLSNIARKVASSGRRICVHCKVVNRKKHQTPWKCQACDVHLCLQLTRNCFQEWHKTL